MLRRGVRFRHGSLFLHQASGSVLVCTRSLWNRNRGLCCHTSCWHLPFIAVSFVFGQFGESLTNTNLTSRAFAITWTWRHFTNADGWHEWKWFQIGDVVFGFPTGRAGHLYQGGIWISRGGTNHVVCVCCVCAICDRAQLLTLPKGQSLSYVHCFIGFTFAFEIDHVQQGGERMESRGHSNLLLFATRLITKWICWMQNKHIFLRSNLPI